jgi:hypothetical protein
MRSTPEELEPLLDSLLWEGYALYPYTPGAIKNATPTPFGIVYPGAYAEGSGSTFDHIELRCLAHAPARAVLSAEVRFLGWAGEGHEAAARRLRLEDTELDALAGEGGGPPRSASCEVEVERGIRGPLRVAMRLHARRREPDLYEVGLRVENRTSCAAGVARGAALAHSLLSTHPLLLLSAGRFSSPTEDGCTSVNTYPVLACPGDDAVLGAAIVLPDHPQIAPESRGGMFDSTEIEEALLLHVHALSDAEREQIESQDPAVREMVRRAAAASPEEILALHGRVTLRDPVSAVPPEEPAGLRDPSEGEPEVEAGGERFRRGGKVRIHAGADADLHARMLDGRIATIERILIDYDGKPHLGVTIDGDPGQDLLRESGRLLYFFPGEVEVLEAAPLEGTRSAPRAGETAP